MGDLMLSGDGDIADVLQQAVETNGKLVALIERLRPLAAFGQAVMDDGQCYSFSIAAKMLSPKLQEVTGHDIGQNRLFDILRAMQILDSRQSHWNEPKQEFAHHFKLVPKSTEIGMKMTPLFTGKGLAWILPKLIEWYRS